MATRIRPSHRRIMAMRVRAQRLLEPLASPADVVQHMLAMQAQDWFGGLWAVARRTHGATAADVETAMAAGDIVRSWPMRGTLHLTPSVDIGWMTALTRARIDRMAAPRHRELGLGDAELERSASIARERLAGGAVVERADLLEAFADGGLDITGQRAPHLLGRLARHATVVMVSRSGFALHDDWVASPRVLERADALGELALRYVRSHGPVTVHDLAWWASLTLADARAGVDAVRDRLDEVVVDGATMLVEAGTAELLDAATDDGAAAAASAAPSVILLPGFDELVIGTTDRQAQLGGEPLERVVPGKNGMFLSTIMLDGVTAGTWRRTLRRDRVDIALDPWRPIPTRRMPALRREARRYGEHLGLPVRIVDDEGSAG